MRIRIWWLPGVEGLGVGLTYPPKWGFQVSLHARQRGIAVLRLLAVGPVFVAWIRWVDGLD